jgi:tetratricopeptide (TPR) repeat protein
MNMRSRDLKLIVSLFLIIITLAVFWQVRNHEFINYDDDDYVTKNRYVHMGRSLLEADGRLDEAIGHYSEAARIGPNYAELRHNLGIAYLRQGKAEEAFRHSSDAIRIKPTMPRRTST